MTNLILETKHSIYNDTIEALDRAKITAPTDRAKVNSRIANLISEKVDRAIINEALNVLITKNLAAFFGFSEKYITVTTTKPIPPTRFGQSNTTTAISAKKIPLTSTESEQPKGKPSVESILDEANKLLASYKASSKSIREALKPENMMRRDLSDQIRTDIRKTIAGPTTKIGTEKNGK